MKISPSESEYLFDILRPILIESLIDIAIPWLFYGIYSVLFTTGVVILKKRKTQNYMWYIIVMIVLFLLATAALWLNLFVVIIRGLDTFQFRLRAGGKSSDVGWETEMNNPVVIHLL
ncbi:hypothetical protein PM082_019613 [Marasmius tenuissimus]|nr:hypothetical protein PM082_019613 [Marasmius tenuissimus]